MITQTYFISSGRLGAMYTLRYVRSGEGVYIDHYVCNLSTDADKAEEKARDYFDRIKSRLVETEDFKLFLNCSADFALSQRRGKLSVYHTAQLDQVGAGIMPFGKHKGKMMASLPAGTVLWYADKVKEDTTQASGEVVFQAVAAYMLGIALENDYIVRREERTAGRAAVDAKSDFMGEIKQRMIFDGTIEGVFPTMFSYVNKLRVDSNIVIYYGKQLGEAGQPIKIKATVKEHTEYKGAKQTIVNRPVIVE